MKLLTKKACQISFDSTTINSLSAYKTKLSASIKGKASYGGVEYSASAAYRGMSSGLKKTDTEYVTSDAKCVVHTSEID